MTLDVVNAFAQVTNSPSTSSLYYTATVSPVTITLGGVNSANQALTGQQITAILNPPVGSVTSYNWTVTGSAFKTYNPSFDSDQKVALSSDTGDFTGSKFYFYDVSKNDVATVTCYANIKLPDGIVQNVSAKSKAVTFMKPTAVWTVKEGYIQAFTLSEYPGCTIFGLASDPASASTYPNGEDWYSVTINVPPMFSSAGQGAFTQLVTPNRTITHSGQVTGGPLPQGLDNTFGFGSWSLPGYGNSGDNPGVKTNPATAAGLTVNDQYYASDSFVTYLMYMPPAAGSQGTIWASLQSYSWSAATTIVWNGSQWNIVRSKSAPNNPSPPTVKGAATDTLPTWNNVHMND